LSSSFCWFASTEFDAVAAVVSVFPADVLSEVPLEQAANTIVTASVAEIREMVSFSISF